MAKVYSECSGCGVQERSDNDVRVKYATTVGLCLCFSRDDGKESCSSKVEEAVKEWADSQGQQSLSDFLGGERP